MSHSTYLVGRVGFEFFVILNIFLASDAPYECASICGIAFLALVRYIGKGTAVPCPYIA
ncbi:MAG: hypothetical protein ACFKPT_03835 [Gloeotrichia echinulata GP01]